MLFAALLIQIWWFKPVGGIYLLILAIKYFFTKKKKEDEDPQTIAEELARKRRSWLYRKTLGAFGPFWSTVILVELMDLRDPLYREIADHLVMTSRRSPRTVCSEIIEMIERARQWRAGYENRDRSMTRR